MSYLNVPRFHFAGTFQADPSTVNNNDSNYDPTVTLSWEPPDPNLSLANTSVYWNPNGTHMFSFNGCSINSVVDDAGTVTTASGSAPIGTVTTSGTYPAKIVDLDPDQQSVSQIYGLVVQLNITDSNKKVIASVQGTMPPSSFGDLWNRVANVSSAQMSNGTMCATYQAQLSHLVWTTPEASPILQSLQAISPTHLSIKFQVDSYQSDMNQGNFTYGRVVGTIGPVLPGEAPRSVPRRMTPAPAQIPIATAYGSAGFVVDTTRQVLILDIGNTVPTCTPGNAKPPATMPTVPADGWPIVPTTFSAFLNVPGMLPGVVYMNPLQPDMPTVTVLGEIAIDGTTYPVNAGIYEIKLSPSDMDLISGVPLQLSDVTQGVNALAEDSQGRYVDVDCPFFRIAPRDIATCTLWATIFGQPWEYVSLDLSILPSGNAMNGPTRAPYCWKNGLPTDGLKLGQTSVTTGPGGTAIVQLEAGSFGQVRMYPDGQPGPDGQIYLVTGSWASWGQIFLFPGAPINVLVFSEYEASPKPTWVADVEPILSLYARLYPYMKSIIDLSDYNSVVFNKDDIYKVLSLPVEDPHHMPVTRDLSPAKKEMIMKWIADGTPQS